MSLGFAAGDDLVFQVESGFGLVRVLASEGEGERAVWHVLVYEDFYPDVEAAEAALSGGTTLAVRNSHIAFTEHAFTKTPAARLGNRPVEAGEWAALEAWRAAGGAVQDRSLLQMIGVR
jgi:hypothetical protein